MQIAVVKCSVAYQQLVIKEEQTLGASEFVAVIVVVDAQR